MKISYNWIKELVDLSSVPDPQALADLLTERGLEVEEIARQDQGLEWVISAEILEKGKHPDSDRLSLCKIKTGKKIAGADEVLEVVCGATNHKTGDKIVLAQVGANLPNGMKIGKGKIRGVESFGMLCSESELGLAKESQGIIILPAHTQVGKPIAEVLGKNDTIFTLKLYANQGHFLSHYGVARELAAALSLRPGLDQVLKSLKKPSSTVKLDWKNSPIAVELKAGDLAPQFLGVLIEGVKVGPSPASVVTRLQACGLRSINNVVDATNILLMELGHPVHAYDADKISGKKIGVRLSGKDEKLPLLDGTTLTLDGSELVIFDGAQAIGLAGVMGGGNSEVTEKTTRVFLECAQFDPVTVRKAKARHQKQTDAAHRFERGVDPQGLGNVISRLATLVIELAGGKTAGSVKAQIKAPAEPVAIEFPYNYVSDFLGLETSASEIEKIFTSLECKFEKVASKDVSSKDGGHWKVTPPSYRLDLKIRQDLAEEVARSVGYDKIPNQIPPLSSAPTPKAFSPAGGESVVMDRAKDVLVKQGLCETINYAFTSQAWLNTFGMKAQAKVINPLSEEHEFLVPSLLPGLVQNAVNNFRHHFGSEKLSVRLFEVRPTFSFEGTGQPSMLSETDTGVKENWKVSMLVTGTRYQQALRAEAGEFDFFDMKAMVEGFLESMGTKGVRLISPDQSRNADHSTLKLLHPGQSIEILAGSSTLGHFGLLHPKLAKSLKLKGAIYLAELDWAVLTKMSRAASQARTYRPWPEFPGMERDFAFVVDQAVTAEKILSVLNKVGKPLVRQAKIFDVYQGSQVPAGKRSVAARVILQDDSRSLTEAEAEEVSKKLVLALQKEVSAELR